MCNCGQDGLKVQNNRLFAYDAGYEEDWYEIEAAKFCPFCGERLQLPKLITTCKSLSVEVLY